MNEALGERSSRRMHARGVLLRAARNLWITVRDLLAYPFVSRVPRDWVVVRLDRGLTDGPMPGDWLRAKRVRNLAQVESLLQRAAADSRVRGVLFRVGRAPLGWAKLRALARQLEALRDAGKRCVVYAENTGNAGAWLGSLADAFWMTLEGRLDLIGIRVSSPYLKKLLDRLGVRGDILKAGRYKGAAEIIDRAAMSEASREALSEVVDGLYGALVRGLASGRAESEEQAREWIDAGPYLAAEAKELGLVDELCYADELGEKLAELSGSEERVPRISDLAYARVSQPAFAFEPLSGGQRVGVVPISGVIRSIETTARPVARALQRAARDTRVAAVVLRIDSPGGDALASDLIWRAVRKLREKMPVVASLSDTAASGGYYAACAADEIFAEDTTLTGSIGVILAGLEFDELLSRLGVNFDGVQRGEHSAIYDPYRRRSQGERALLKRQVRHHYETFLERVAEGRSKSTQEIAPAAEGRVWTGARARELELGDHLGGLSDAVARAGALAEICGPPDEPVWLSPQPSLLDRMRNLEAARSPLLETEPWLEMQYYCPVAIALR